RLNIAMMSSLVPAGGYGVFDAMQLNKKLSGSTATASIGCGSVEDVINADCSTKDLETMFQLMYLKFTQPRKDIKAFESLTSRIRNNLKDRNLNPNTALSDTLVRALYDNHPRVMPLLASDVDKVDYDRVLEIYRERTSDATGYTFIIVGNVDLATLKPLVERYIGALPCNGRVEELVASPVKVREGVYKNNFKNKMETPTGTQLVTYTGNIEPTQKNSITMSFLYQILNIVYTEEVREKEGGTYGVGVQGSISDEPENRYSLSINFKMSPDRREELLAIVIRQFEKMAAEGPASEHVEKIRSYLLKSFEESQKKNAAWKSWMYRYFFQGKNTHDNFVGIVNGITAEDIRLLAKYILDQGNYIEVSMTPAE
ncbi:MAG: insulinase family protein, partial [Bacteroidaceae bacterium]|nr:insulinase family protein [Bacteroidaceae bacterium]